MKSQDLRISDDGKTDLYQGDLDSNGNKFLSFTGHPSLDIETIIDDVNLPISRSEISVAKGLACNAVESMLDQALENRSLATS